MNDSTYRLYFVTGTQSESYIFYKQNIPITQNYVEIPCILSAYTGTLRVWVNLSDAATGEYTLTNDRSHNIISKECYIQDVEDSRVTAIENNATELQQEIQDITGEIEEFNSGNMSDFTSGYYLPPTATSFSVSNLVSNSNLCYKHYQISEGTKIIEVYSGYRDNYNYENIFFLANDNSVIERKSMLKNGIYYLVPNGTVYICVCYLKDYKPFGFVLFKSSSLEDTLGLDIREQTKEQVENDIQDYSYITQTHQEITLRDVCYEMERRNPFNWKPFNKKWFAFMNDDGNQDMTQYYKVCRDRRVPYCHAFILDRFSSYPYTGNDANRRNLVKNPAIGQSYTFDKLDTQTYLRLYFDRQYSLGFPLNITVNNVSHTINSADNARISIGDDTSVSFTITSIGQLTSGRTDYINIIATADSADSSVSTVSWTTEEMLKNIVFDFGEILAHANDVINMWDLKQVEEKLALYLYGIPQSIDNILGEEHCKGAILPGGPNSERNMNTDIGQHYCCRYILYSDYYGTTPQYMIQRTTFKKLAGSASGDYSSAKTNALIWLSDPNNTNGFYPLFTHSEKTPEEVAGVIDAILETEGTICSNWYTTYYANS